MGSLRDFKKEKSDISEIGKKRREEKRRERERERERKPREK